MSSDRSSLPRQRCWPLVIALAVLSLASALGPRPARATELFVQPAISDRYANALNLGVNWDWAWPQKLFPHTALQGYVEGMVGRWYYDQKRPNQFLSTRYGITPGFRYALGGSQRWYFDMGVGANLISPHFHAGRTVFGGEFNFGSHAGILARLGDDRRYGLELSIEHLSNASIQPPNPGINFLALRASMQLGR